MFEQLGDVPATFSGPSSIVQLALGATLLLFGRRLAWLFVAAVGFAAGLLVADAYLAVDSETTRWIIGLGVGAASALAAVLLQRLAVGVAGALVAGYCAYWYVSLPGAPLETWHWLLVAVSAAVGLLVARTVFDFGLILLSSLAGATLVLDGLGSEPDVSRWLYVGLVVVGAAVQVRSLPRDKD